KGEYYITDSLSILQQRGRRVVAKTSVPAADATGINSRADLAEVSHMMQRRIATRIMDQGATIVAPELTWIEAGTEIGPETIIQPFTFIGRSARIGAGCVIGPMAMVARGETIPDGRTIAGNLADAGDPAPAVRLAHMAMAAQGRGV